MLVGGQVSFQFAPLALHVKSMDIVAVTTTLRGVRGV